MATWLSKSKFLRFKNVENINIERNKTEQIAPVQRKLIKTAPPHLPAKSADRKNKPAVYSFLGKILSSVCSGENSSAILLMA